MVNLADSKDGVVCDYPDKDFRAAVVADLTRRRDEYCPTDENSEFGIRNSELPSEHP
jgi:hypothetical protein